MAALTFLQFLLAGLKEVQFILIIPSIMFYEVRVNTELTNTTKSLLLGEIQGEGPARVLK